MSKGNHFASGDHAELSELISRMGACIAHQKVTAPVRKDKKKPQKGVSQKS